MSILAPYATKGVEELTKAVGDVAYDKAKHLFATLKARWAGDAPAADQLERFQRKPAVYGPALEDVLKEKLQSDQQLAGEVEQEVKDFGPQIRIFLKMAQGENVTVLEAHEMTKGRVDADVNIDSGKNITVTKFDRIGG
jgi:hypothetical protein